MESFEVPALSNCLRQPDNLLFEKLSNDKPFEETHGFASLPRGRFAFIVCNRLSVKTYAATLEQRLLYSTVFDYVCQ
jgi:hypothetical protein